MTKPAELYGDKGSGYAQPRRRLRSRGIRHRIARKGVHPSARLGRHRWVVERTARKAGLLFCLVSRSGAATGLPVRGRYC